MSRRIATSASPAVTAPPTATDFSAPPTLSRGEDVPPTRPHIRATTEACPARHPQEREAEVPGGPVPFDALDLGRRNEEQPRADTRAPRQPPHHPGRRVVRG
ncbi:hypothetical protein [Streptomyces sp. NPDC127066]|uniref:hypothetical protein n=1 Tax=Streptomyces sp. NPDC127066 TaxID=3347125 RepID=UPI00366979FC